MWPGTAPSRRLHGRSHPGILIFGKSQPGVSEDNFTDGECTAMPTPLYTAAKQEAAPALCHLPDCQVAALTHLQNGVLQGRLDLPSQRRQHFSIPFRICIWKILTTLDLMQLNSENNEGPKLISSHTYSHGLLKKKNNGSLYTASRNRRTCLLFLAVHVLYFNSFYKWKPSYRVQ